MHDVRRAAILLYVELEARPDGSRLYLTRPLARAADPNGEVFEALDVAPGREAPIYMTLPLPAARQVAAALDAPLRDEGVTLETFADFVALVDRAALIEGEATRG